MSASLLLPRNVPSAADHRPEFGGVVARFATLVYSMAGSLWQQQIDSLRRQLTSGPGYDYQPDCSPDGRWIVYASYFKDAIELWVLDFDTQRNAAAHARGRREC